MKALKNLLLLLFLVTFNTFSQSSSDTYVYQENFNSKGNWPSGSNEYRELNVYNGRYYFEHKRSEKFWTISSASYNLDTSKDFDIETSIQKVSGVDNSGISFLYDYKDGKNYKEFGYTASGYFRIAKSVNGSYSKQADSLNMITPKDDKRNVQFNTLFGTNVSKYLRKKNLKQDYYFMSGEIK